MARGRCWSGWASRTATATPGPARSVRARRHLGGLVLIDLPDHDGAAAGAAVETNRLVGLADLMLWVLDPQKYADAPVHRRYLTPLAGHASVIAVVLNQSHPLSPEQAGYPRDRPDPAARLRRAARRPGPRHLGPDRRGPGQAGQGAGRDRHRAACRDGPDRGRPRRDGRAVRPLRRGGPRRGPGCRHRGLRRGPPGQRRGPGGVVQQGGRGGRGVGQALQSARELRAVHYVGWPVSWLVDRGARPRSRAQAPARQPVGGTGAGYPAAPPGRSRRRSTTCSPPSASRFAPALPLPWSNTVRAAARSKRDEIPGALGRAIGESLPEENSVDAWWRVVAVGRDCCWAAS